MFMTAIAVAAVTGTLCFGDVCTKTEGTEIKVAPEKSERHFVWTSSDGKSIVLGVVPKNAEKIALDAEDLREVKFTARGEKQRGWPADLRVQIEAPEHSWRWTIPSRAASQAQSIRIPAGRYLLMLSADRYRTLYRNRLDATKPLALGELNLEPLPVVRGVVVNPKEEPLGGVQIVAGSKVCTTTDEKGAFRCELQEPFPKELSIEYPGFGRRFVATEFSPGDFDAGRIVLSRGSNLVVYVRRPDALFERKMTARLMQHIPRKHEAVEAAKVNLEPKRDDLSFSGVARGKYNIVLEGDGPFERLSVPVEIKEAIDAEQTIAIEPFELKGEILVGEELTPAKGGIEDPDQSFRIEFTSEDGRFGGAMWQHGKVRGWAQPKDMTGDLIESPELGDDPSIWRIVVKERFITGRVYDASTNEPIKGIDIGLQFEGQRGEKALMNVDVSDDGRYRVQAGRPGSYRLSMHAPGYVSATATAVIADDATTKNIDFPMERGTEVILELVWPDGTPAANAAVIDGAHFADINADHYYSADATGRLRLRMRKGETRTVYVLPQEGSFASVNLRSSDEVRTERVTIPYGNATLHLLGVDENEKPERFYLVLRYNGEFIPRSVWGRIHSSIRQRAREGEIILRALPPGVYEAWGFMKREDEAAFLAAGGGIPPVRIGLSTGEETVQITVPARE